MVVIIISLYYFGNPQCVERANNFIDRCQTGSWQKAMLLCGLPGVGKTHLTDYIAEKRGYESYIVNASDERTKNKLQFVRDIISSQGGLGIMVVLDECEGMKEKELLKIIELTKVPLFLCCNYDDNISYKVKEKCDVMKITAPEWWHFKSYMVTLCNKYNIQLDPKDLEKRAKKAKSFRHAERLIDDPDDNGVESEKTEYEIVEDILHGRESPDHIDMKPADLNLWLFDNSDNSLRSSTLASSVDIMLERAYLHDYRFWSYAYGMMNCARSNTKVTYPRSIRLMSAIKKARQKIIEEKAAEQAGVDIKIKVDINKLSTKVIETGNSLFGDIDLSDLGLSNNVDQLSQLNLDEPTITINKPKEVQSDIGEWI